MTEDTKLQAIAGVQVTVAARLAEKSLSLGEVLELSPGGMVSFPQKVGDDVHLEVDGLTVGRGHIVERAGRLGFLLLERRAGAAPATDRPG